MCGRFVYQGNLEVIVDRFAIAKVLEALEASYNVASTQKVQAVVGSR